MEVFILLSIIIGSGLLGWGIGFDLPLATVSGFAVLALGVLATFGLRLRPALLAVTTVLVLTIAGSAALVRA